MSAPAPTPASAAQELDALLAEWRGKGRFPVGIRAKLIDRARVLLESDAGLDLLAERVPGLIEEGFLRGTAWDDPAKLQPPLVKGSLLAPGETSAFEAISELRMLSIALGRLASERATAADAQRFLEEALVLNLDLLQMGAQEAHRLAEGEVLDRARRVVARVARELPLDRLRDVLLEEVEALCRQRRILTAAAVDMIQRAARYADRGGDAVARRLQGYVDAIAGPTPLAREHPEPAAYGAALEALKLDGLEDEAHAFGRSLQETGLACPLHAVLLHTLRKVGSSQLLGRALGLDALGLAELARHPKLTAALIERGVAPGCIQAIAGLAGALQRGLLSKPEVAAGLKNLLQREPCPAAAERLLRSRPFDELETDPRSLLLGGALAVLGQPLGVGQGDAPTCQSARGISLWSQVAPGYLLELLVQAAVDDSVYVRFRGVELASRDLPGRDLGSGTLWTDPVSAVLVPHLDRIYQAMLGQVEGQPGDPHRYVNPGLYGPWVPTHFRCVFENGQPVDPEPFVRAFLAVHLPQAEAAPAMHPRPLGLVVTTTHGVYLGLHAVTLQRVARGPDGEVRAYFYNPNDDGRQDWGQGLRPSTQGHGEEPGESSLPLVPFASRVYAFHHHAYELRGVEEVDAELVQLAVSLAAESWGQAFASPSAEQPAL